MHWTGVKNGELLKLVESAGFDVFVTGDKNMRKQNRVHGLPFAIVQLSATNWPVIRPHVSLVSQAVDDARPGAFASVQCGDFVPRKSRRTRD
jgi:hypothetical protein